MIHPTLATKKSKHQRDQDPSPLPDKDDERTPRVSETPQRSDSSDDEMDDQEIPSPRTRDGQSSALSDEDLLLQDQPQAPNAADSQQRREVARLNPFDKATPFLPEDYDDWALSFKLYCTPDECRTFC
jgi:hypothetical protein